MDFNECGRPIRRRGEATACILPAGHRDTWCQDERALAALDKLGEVPQKAHDCRALLGLFGIDIGRKDAERLAYRLLWQGKA